MSTHATRLDDAPHGHGHITFTNVRPADYWAEQGYDYHAGIRWERAGAVFTDNRYSRAHTWAFDGGALVPASSSPHVVRPPMSDASAVDPEEAYVASLASCHMLTFLFVAAKAGFAVASYRSRSCKRFQAMFQPPPTT